MAFLEETPCLSGQTDTDTDTDTIIDTPGDYSEGDLGSLTRCVVRDVWDGIKGEILGLAGPVIQGIPGVLEGALQEFINYFETTWLSENRKEWCVRGIEALRSANDLGSWHDRMSIALHPKDTLWRAIAHIKDEQSAREKDVEKILQGNVGVPQRRFRKQKEEAINLALIEYSSGNISACELVNRISYRMNH